MNLYLKVANLIVEKNLLKPYEAVDISFSNSRLEEIENNKQVKSKNRKDSFIAPTITTNITNYGFNIPVNNNQENLEMNNLRIRKLTPKECWRLMGFDDEDVDKSIAIGISNSQLYKQAGNSIVVNVLEGILKNASKYFA